jgi:hypothetical protein
MSPNPLAALLLRPDVILAISTATEVIVRDLLREVFAMSEEELTVFIAEQDRRRGDHEAWLRAHQPRTP